jgi:lysine 2,3-aminomutase
MLVSQSVLLKGVNDKADVLADLMRAFLENRIKPYYLHHPDLAPGTGHFRIGIEDGLALMKALRAKLSGLAMPTYMLDIPGGFGKVPLDSDHVEKTATGHRIRDHAGRWHDYICS